jgi:transposase
MSGFIEGEDRTQATLFPERIDDYITLSGLRFKTMPESTGRTGYRPSLMLKLFIYGYLSRVQSSRLLEQ